MGRTRVMLCRGAAAAMVALVVYSTPARADAVKITTGAFSLSRQNFAALDLGNGTSFQLNGIVGGDNDNYFPPYGCGLGQGCAGRTFNLSMNDELTAGPVSAGEPSLTGSFTSDGVRYDLDAFDFKIMAGNIVAPSGAFATTAFHLIATARGTTLSGTTQSIQLHGRGTASSFWDARNGWISTDYNFQDVTQTPEPASMMLLATGLSGLVAARKRARRRK
jgi:hypothetical protein